MKKIILVVILLILVAFIARVTYSIGEHNAHLTVQEATPKQLALAMQSDNFYGEYPQTILLLKGTIKTVTRQRQDTIVQFVTTQSTNVLPKVTCDLGKDPEVKTGETIQVVTVAHDAQRQNTADIFMPSCYLIKQ